MNKTIYKYEIHPSNLVLELPEGAEILTVQSQHEEAFIWALVNPYNKKAFRYFELFGTGHPVPCDMGINRRYIGTFQLSGGALVFHLFERIN